MIAGRDLVFTDVEVERHRQDAKWGKQSHPDGTGEWFANDARFYRERCEKRAELGRLSWHDILREEIAEAYAESDPAKLREELIQAIAVAVAWVEDIDRRT